MFWIKNFILPRHFQIIHWLTKGAQATPGIMQYLGSISLVSMLHLSIKILLKSYFKYLNPVAGFNLEGFIFYFRHDPELWEKTSLIWWNHKHTDRTLVLEKEGGFGARQYAGEKGTAEINHAGQKHCNSYLCPGTVHLFSVRLRASCSISASIPHLHNGCHP